MEVRAEEDLINLDSSSVWGPMCWGGAVSAAVCGSLSSGAGCSHRLSHDTQGVCRCQRDSGYPATRRVALQLHAQISGSLKILPEFPSRDDPLSCFLDQ